jgi:hypothetical protein
MYPTPAKIGWGVAIAAIIAGVGACHSAPAPSPRTGHSRVSPSLVLALGEGRTGASSWEQSRNDAALGTRPRRKAESEAMVVERTVQRLHTTNGRPREHSLWTTRIQRATRIP